MDDDALHSRPLAHAVSLPADAYVGPAAMARDTEAIFGRSWQLVGRSEQVRAVGDHLVASLGNLPLVVVRGEDGTLRALHNVCRHRAGPLAIADGRAARALTCRYHGWTYGLDGVLRAAPEMRGVEDFAPDAIRLPLVAAVEWQGLVFANPAKPTAHSAPFGALIEGIDARLVHARLADHAFSHRVSYDVACDWKVYVENYLEGYHLPLVHPSLSKVLDYGAYRTETSRWHSLQWSPIDDLSGPYAAGEALYYWLFPNTMLNVLPGRLQTNRVVPTGPGRCRVDFDYFYAPGTPRTTIDADARFADDVQAEDIAICEAVQRGLASGSYVPGRLNPHRESGVHHFQELVREAWREGRREG